MKKFKKKEKIPSNYNNYVEHKWWKITSLISREGDLINKQYFSFFNYA